MVENNARFLEDYYDHIIEQGQINKIACITHHRDYVDLIFIATED